MRTIWFISHNAMPPHMAVRTRTNNFARLLSERGYGVEIFSASTIHNTDINMIADGELYIENEYDGVIYNHVRTSSYSGNGIKRMINMMQFPLRLRKVSRLKERKPDVVVCNLQSVFGVVPYLISRSFGSMFIAEVRDLWPESIVEFKGISRRNIVIRLLYRFERWIYERADEIIFSMEGGKDYLIDRGINSTVNMEKVHHIGNGVDIPKFEYNKRNFVVNDELINREDIFKVVYCGSIREANNVGFLVDVAKVIQSKGIEGIQFIIYGDGPERARLERICVEQDISNIRFEGFVDKKYIPYILSKSDLNVLVYKQAGTWKYGGSQNKLNEYIVSGKPILSSIDMSYNQIVKHNCGRVCATSDSEVFAEAIIEFYQMEPAEYAAYCNNELNAIQTLDYSNLVSQLERVIDGK